MLQTVGLWLSFGGVAIAIYQLVRMGRIVLWTRRAVAQTSQQVNIYSVLAILPDLHLVEHKLDAAIRADEVDETRALILEWKRIAADLGGVLDEVPQVADEVSKTITKSLQSATLAKGRLDKTRNATEAQSLLTQISTVCTAVRTFAAHVKAQPPVPPDTRLLADLQELYLPSRFTKRRAIDRKVDAK